MEVQLQNANSMKTVISLIKYIPIVINLYIILIMSDILTSELYPFFGQSFLFNGFLLVCSFAFRFCLWHRILIFSMSLCLFLEFLQNCGMLINNFEHICITFTVVAMFASTLLIYLYGCYVKKKID